ncbi:MAG: hypothetical protein KGL39_48510 [Patescibacteria group bacterium]|nr:hypothetical protein [Patescibacteria group bacterium]
MNGKPVFTVPGRVINFDSGFKHKLLCDGPTFSTGTACVYSCSFCYVPSVMKKLVGDPGDKFPLKHEEMVIRRRDAVNTVLSQLTDADGRPKFNDPNDRRVIYASPLVDVAANMELIRETVDVCREILELTHWQIRLLSKSNLLPEIAKRLADFPYDNISWPVTEKDVKERMIFGVSTGTLNDELAGAFEEDTPKVSKRIKSLHWLQDNGFRTFGMICPSLPQNDYECFAREMSAAIRVDRCEHVWAEVMNVRGESFVRTIKALSNVGYGQEAYRLAEVSKEKAAWEEYARATFLAHSHFIPPTKLRFMQYVTKDNRSWWDQHKHLGAVLL